MSREPARLARIVSDLADSHARVSEAVDELTDDVSDVREELAAHTSRLVRLEAAAARRRRSTWAPVRAELAAGAVAALAHLRRHPGRVLLTLAALAGALGWDRLEAVVRAALGASTGAP